MTEWALVNSCIGAGDKHFVMSVQIVTKAMDFGAKNAKCLAGAARQIRRH
jgi:hypothetical protein